MEPLTAARIALLLTDKKFWKTIGIVLLVIIFAVAAILFLIPLGIILGVMMAITPAEGDLANDAAYAAIQQVREERSISNDLPVSAVKAVKFTLDGDLPDSKGEWKRFVTTYFVKSRKIKVTVEVPGANPDDPPHTETREKTIYEFRTSSDILSKLEGPPFSFADSDLRFIETLFTEPGGGELLPGDSDDLPSGGGIGSIVGGNAHLTQRWHDRGISSGIDIGAAKGTPCYAMFDGTVKYYYWKNYNGALVGYGACAFLYSDDGRYKAVYAHFSQFNTVQSGLIISSMPSVQTYMPTFQEYQYSIKVQKGDIIGRIGNTGYSFGNHLHFGLHIDGVAVDPLKYLK